jgi:hypothetical protein
MVAIQVRGVSDETRRILAEEAERRGQSLQLFLADVLEREAASASNLAFLREAAARPRLVGPDVDIAELIRAGHEERDRQILEAVQASFSKPGSA